MKKIFFTILMALCLTVSTAEARGPHHHHHHKDLWWSIPVGMVLGAALTTNNQPQYVVQQPVYTQPVYPQYVAPQPVYTQPVYSAPAYSRPVKVETTYVDPYTGSRTTVVTVP